MFHIHLLSKYSFSSNLLCKLLIALISGSVAFTLSSSFFLFSFHLIQVNFLFEKLCMCDRDCFVSRRSRALQNVSYIRRKKKSHHLCLWAVNLQFLQKRQKIHTKSIKNTLGILRKEFCQCLMVVSGS